MPRKQSRGGFDYATPRMAYGPPAYGIAYQQPPYYGYPTATLQNGVYAGAYLNGWANCAEQHKKTIFVQLIVMMI